jgi:hypothetical protein
LYAALHDRRRKPVTAGAYVFPHRLSPVTDRDGPIKNILNVGPHRVRQSQGYKHAEPGIARASTAVARISKRIPEREPFEAEIAALSDACDGCAVASAMGHP